MRGLRARLDAVDNRMAAIERGIDTVAAVGQAMLHDDRHQPVKRKRATQESGTREAGAPGMAGRVCPDE